MDILLCLKNQKEILEMHDSLIVCEAIINSADLKRIKISVNLR